jgi:ribosomal protein S18 acetylase RimI-like enzyme
MPTRAGLPIGRGPAAPVAIRPAAARDVPGVAALWSAIHAHHAPLDPQFEVRPDAERALAALLDDELREADIAVFVAESASELVGFCAVRPRPAPALLVETGRAEITELYVRDADRRRGVGRALVDAALDWVRGRGIERVEVRVAARNAEGQAFWRELGFGDLMDVLQRRL